MLPMLRVGLLIVIASLSLPVAAKSCYVTAETSGVVPPPVVTEKCFEHPGAKEDSIDWACQDNEGVENSTREIRDSCPAGYFGKCTAPLTPEALSNERASGSQAEGVMPTTVPEDAQIVTYNYQASDEAQAKIDCESGGGEWSQ